MEYIDREDVKKLRNEYHNKKFKEYVLSVNGTRCVNCGEEYAELHHIVPLVFGGTNNVNNIVPLCYVCHKLAHGSVGVNKLNKSATGGRPKMKLSSDREYALSEFERGKIGTRECKYMCGMKQSTHFTDMDFYNEYLEKKGIVKIKNSVDLLKNKNGYVPDGKKISKVVYCDGREKIYMSVRK